MCVVEILIFRQEFVGPVFIFPFPSDEQHLLVLRRELEKREKALVVLSATRSDFSML